MGLEVKEDAKNGFDSLQNIKLNGSYEGLKVKVKPITVNDDLVRQRAKDAFEHQVSKIEVTDRSPQEGDYTNIKFEAVDENGVKVENACGNLTFQIGKNQVYQEIDACVKALKKGETGNTEVKFPENHPSLPGKNLKFTINLEKIEELPQFNDESVKSMNLPEVSTVDQYVEKVKVQILNSEAQKRDNEVNRSLQSQLESLVNASELPKVLIEANTNMSYENFLNSLEMYGIKKDDYFTRTGQTEEDFKEVLKKQAVSDLQLKAALGKIVAEKDFKASTEELQKEKEVIMQEYQIKEEDFEKQIGSEQLEESLKMRKAFEYVRSSSVLEEVSEAEKEV